MPLLGLAILVYHRIGGIAVGIQRTERLTERIHGVLLAEEPAALQRLQLPAGLLESGTFDELRCLGLCSGEDVRYDACTATVDDGRGLIEPPSGTRPALVHAAACDGFNDGFLQLVVEVERHLGYEGHPRRHERGKDILRAELAIGHQDH